MAAYGDHERSITVIAVSPDGTRLASCSDGDVNVRELPTGTIIAKLQLPHMECESLAIIGDQLIGATGNAAHIVPIEDGAKPRTIALSAGRKYGTSAFAVSPDGSLLAGGGDDGQIAVHSADGTRRWGATMPKDPNEENERYTVRALAFDDTGTQLAAVTDDDNLRLYDARTGRVLRTQPVTLASGWLTSVAFMGTRVAVGASSGEVFVIDAQGKIVFTANQTIGGIFALAATKTRLFTGGESGDVVEWDVP
jgi:WD40 repeat protein